MLNDAVVHVYDERGVEVAYGDETRQVVSNLRQPETPARNRNIGVILLRWLKTGFPVEMMLRECGNLQLDLADRCLQAAGCSRSVESFRQSDWWSDKTR